MDCTCKTGQTAAKKFLSKGIDNADRVVKSGLLPPRIPGGEYWENLMTGEWHHGGRWYSDGLEKINGYMKIGGKNTPSTNIGLPNNIKASIGNPTNFDQLRKLFENGTKKLKDVMEDGLGG